MGKPYSDDLRERVAAAIEAGHSRVKVAELYNMALSTVGGFIKRKRETGSVISVQTSSAGTWPVRPVTLVVTFAAGSGDDVLARILSPRLSQLLGQQIVVENVGGAGGMTGVARVAKARPDGYQFVLGGTGTFAANQTLYKHPLYNAATDFAPVALIAEQPLLLTARQDLPVGNLAEFIAYAKMNEAKLQYASGGVGSATHLGCVLLNS
jgi:tripartite-type tricarboxylate transporter receptor subunit TctC